MAEAWHNLICRLHVSRRGPATAKRECRQTRQVLQRGIDVLPLTNTKCGETNNFIREKDLCAVLFCPCPHPLLLGGGASTASIKSSLGSSKTGAWEYHAVQACALSRANEMLSQAGWSFGLLRFLFRAANVPTYQTWNYLGQHLRVLRCPAVLGRRHHGFDVRTEILPLFSQFLLHVPGGQVRGEAGTRRGRLLERTHRVGGIFRAHAAIPGDAVTVPVRRDSRCDGHP